MDTKSKSPKIAEMKQYDVKMNLDSAGNVTGKQNWRSLRAEYFKMYVFSLEYQILYIHIIYIYIDIHNKIEI